VIERLVYSARAADEVTVATSDGLQRDFALGRGIKTVSAMVLRGQIEATLQRRNQQIGDTRARSDISRRLEDRLDAKSRERLDRIRRGEDPGK
jgi:predicted RNA-binding protein with PIN domain